MPLGRSLRPSYLLIVLFVALTAVILLDRAFPPDLSRLRAVGVEVLDRDGRTLSVLPAVGGTWRLATAVDRVST